MALRSLVVLVMGLSVLLLLGACSNNKSADVVIPTLAVLPGASSPTQDEVTSTPASPVAPTMPPDIQSGVDQFFTQTAQAQLQIAPTETLVAAFNQALTSTAQSIFAIQQSTFDGTMTELASFGAPTLFASITPLGFGGFGTASTQPAPANATTCSPPANWVQYTIQGGDSLAALAQATNTSVQTIVQANCLPDADTIYTGQVIYLPSSPISG